MLVLRPKKVVKLIWFRAGSKSWLHQFLFLLPSDIQRTEEKPRNFILSRRLIGVCIDLFLLLVNRKPRDTPTPEKVKLRNYLTWIWLWDGGGIIPWEITCTNLISCSFAAQIHPILFEKTLQKCNVCYLILEEPIKIWPWAITNKNHHWNQDLLSQR